MGNSKIGHLQWRNPFKASAGLRPQSTNQRTGEGFFKSSALVVCHRAHQLPPCPIAPVYGSTRGALRACACLYSRPPPRAKPPCPPSPCQVIEAVLPVRQKLQKQPSQPLPSSTPTPTPTGTGMVSTPPQPQPQAGDATERPAASDDLCCMSGDVGGGGGAGGALGISPAGLQQQHSLQHQASQHPHLQHQHQQQAASGGAGAVSSSTTSATAPPPGLLRLAADSPSASPHRSSVEPDLDSGCSPLLHPTTSTLEQWMRSRPASCKQQQHSKHRHQQQQQQQHSRSVDEERWLEIWKVWVREASLLVQVYDARPNEMYIKRLDEAFGKLRQAEHELDLAHPELVCNMCVCVRVCMCICVC